MYKTGKSTQKVHYPQAKLLQGLMIKSFDSWDILQNIHLIILTTKTFSPDMIFINGNSKIVPTNPVYPLL